MYLFQKHILTHQPCFQSFEGLPDVDSMGKGGGTNMNKASQMCGSDVGVCGSAGLHFKQMWCARDLVFGQFLSLAL